MGGVRGWEQVCADSSRWGRRQEGKVGGDRQVCCSRCARLTVEACLWCLLQMCMAIYVCERQQTATAAQPATLECHRVLESTRSSACIDRCTHCQRVGGGGVCDTFWSPCGPSQQEARRCPFDCTGRSAFGRCCDVQSACTHTLHEAAGACTCTLVTCQSVRKFCRVLGPKTKQPSSRPSSPTTAASVSAGIQGNWQGSAAGAASRCMNTRHRQGMVELQQQQAVRLTTDGCWVSAGPHRRRHCLSSCWCVCRAGLRHWKVLLIKTIQPGAPGGPLRPVPTRFAI